MNELMNIVGSYGFPIAVTAFVLFRLEKSMEKVEEALMKLTEALIRIESIHNR